VPARTSEVGRWRVEHHVRLDSTNRYLLDAARAGAADGLVVVADVQTAGRGRLDRSWEAPPGSSLLVSVLVRVPERADPGPVVMATAVALAEAVGNVAGIEPALKWPNDLVVADRKLAGILAERDGDGLVVGVGCNVNWDEFPPDLASTATACNLEAGRSVDRDALLVEFLERLERALRAGTNVIGEYRARLETLERRVRVQPLRGDDIVGRATAVTDDGALVVRDDAGVDHTVVTADVVHLQPE
jgi:BirA family transcriptional regulator, biotin operon repressor / biotin---[acetyl-CoA-carboxylase] ligase